MGRRSLLFNSTVYVIGQFATKALAFVMLVVYARFLEPEDFGITGTLAAYSAVLAAVFLLGLHGAVGRHYFDHRNEPALLRSYLSTVYAFQVGLSALIVVALELWGETLWQRYTSGSIPFDYVRIALWTTFATTLAQLPQTVYQAEERSATLVGWQLAHALLTLGAGILFVVALRQRALGVLRSQLVAAGFIAVVLFVAYFRRWGGGEIRWAHARRALGFGLPLLPHVLGTILIQSVDRIMLEKYVSQTEVGHYSIAMTLGMILGMVAGGINQAWSPHFFRTSKDEPAAEARAKAEQFASLFVALFTALSLLGALLAPELIYVLGAKYVPVVPYLIPFVIGNLIGIVYYLPATQLMYESRTGWFIVATGLATVLSVGLNLWFLPRGAGGMVAAWIFVTGIAVQTGIVMLAARLYQPSLLGPRHALVFILAMAALALAVRDASLPMRAGLLAGGLAVTYVLLVRGNVRGVLPRRLQAP